MLLDSGILVAYYNRRDARTPPSSPSPRSFATLDRRHFGAVQAKVGLELLP
jgi:hypothetical protein